MAQETGWDKATSPYHRGEQELQDRLGKKERMEVVGRHIHRPYMPDEHREFFKQLPILVVGSVDQQARPWASVIYGNPGFVSCPTDRKMKIDATIIEEDPLAKNLGAGSPVGLLGIEMPTRRRNRMNGIVTNYQESGFSVDVVQSFGNCPKYIQSRTSTFNHSPDQREGKELQHLSNLDHAAVELIRTSDTFFVASHNHEDDVRDTGGVDVNYRGGQPGFVKVEDDVLTIPDFIGNNAFNTLGNFLINPKAGLLFIDFETGEHLMLTGTAEVIWEKTAEVEAFKGAERTWKFTLEYGIRIKNASPMFWEFGEYSPKTISTGQW